MPPSQPDSFCRCPFSTISNYLWFAKPMVCMRVTFHENDRNNENDETTKTTPKGVSLWWFPNGGSSLVWRANRLWMRLFCLQMEASCLQWSFLLKIDNFSFSTYNVSFFGGGGEVRLIRALRDCKRRSLTVSKKTPTVSRKTSPIEFPYPFLPQFYFLSSFLPLFNLNLPLGSFETIFSGYSLK